MNTARSMSGGSCHHELMLDLTNQREVSALHGTLRRAIQALCPQHATSLFSLAEQRQVWRLICVHEDSDGAFENDAMLVAGLEALAHLSVEQRVHVVPDVSGTVYTLFPVRSGPTLLGAVVLGGESLADQQKTVEVLVSVYANQLAILNRTKRDTLTGLLNRHAFDEKISRIFGDSAPKRRRGKDTRGRWCLAFLDIDHFKRINDTFGHLYGDEVLLLFARIMTNSFRDEDMLFRYGGEEFVVMLSDVEQKIAWQVLDRFREKVEAYDFPQVGTVTVSIGYTIPESLMPFATILDHGDKALYFAKGNGRNRVCSYEGLVAQGDLEPEFSAGAGIELF